jgi:predicted metal-binding membrane protein
MPAPDASVTLAVTRGILVTAATAATLAAWALVGGSTLLMPHQHTAAPAFAAALLMWLAMVVAMMTPTVLPWILAYATLVTPADGTRPWQAIAAFATGYLTVWFGYSVTAAALQMTLARTGLLLGDRLGAALGGTVLIAAGVFQVMPLKAACLAHCRSPLSYFIARWRDGPIGGLRLGLSHGAYCLGCCWLVMLTALAMGVMNLAWMAVLTAVVVLEQVAPGGLWVGRVCGAGLLGWGVWLIA